MSAPEPWYMTRPGARLVGRAALTGGLVCALGYIGIVYLSLQPVRQFNHLTLIGRVALLFVLGLCASLVTVVLWYRPKASSCLFGLVALTTTLASAVAFVATVLNSPVAAKQIGHSGIRDSVILLVIVGSGVCPLIILLSFALDRIVLPAVVALVVLVGVENFLLAMMPIWTFMLAMRWKLAALVYLSAWPVVIALVIVRIVKYPRAGLLSK